MAIPVATHPGAKAKLRKLAPAQGIGRKTLVQPGRFQAVVQNGQRFREDIFQVMDDVPALGAQFRLFQIDVAGAPEQFEQFLDLIAVLLAF